jgi:diguanylate cyclase (GGDEF)-like protein
VYRVLKKPEHLKKIVLEKNKALKHLAFHDTLTGLMNRHLLYEAIEKNISLLHQKGSLFALLYIDLDDFKRINDTLGHDAGDDVLKEMTRRMISIVKNVGVVSRLGGDGFVILLADIQSRESVENIAEQLIDVLAQTIVLGDRELVVTASMGIIFSPNDVSLAEDLLLKADLALCASKNAGKNRYAFYDQAMQNQMMARLDVEEGVREALQKDQFYLAFQPIVCFKTEKTIKFEALIRWDHPEKGLLYPDSFIEVSEQTGLIVPLGKVVLQKACEFVRHCQVSDKVVPIVTVNVSPRQFSESGFIHDVVGVVKEAGVEPHYIQLEITESVLMEDVEKGIQTMNALKQEGFLFLMDDFGTGYSSLSQLKQLPVSTLKIDRSFISDRAEDYKIIAAIIAMASELGLEVIAEGIETEAHLMLLKEHGCQFGQGYLFSRPMPEKHLVLEAVALV